VDLAADAEAAIACAEQATYAGFLIDITLRSERNGIDVLEHLRTQPCYRATPMIAVTAHALPGDRERFLSAGFDAYLSKPFKRDALHRTLARLVGQPRAARSAERRISQNARPVNA
jgi:CheY-like chemotaxis protein